LISGPIILFLYLYQAYLGPTVNHLPTTRLFAVDFYAYWLAAGRLLHGVSPYANQMLEGLTSNQGLGHYLYPPPFAFFCLPFTTLSYQIAGWIWIGLSVIAFTVGTSLILRMQKGYLSFSRLLWALAATIWFLPCWDSLWKGNVEGLQVLLIALTLVTGGKSRILGVTAHAWLKVSPVFLVPALLVRDKKAAFLAWFYSPACWSYLALFSHRSVIGNYPKC